MYIIVRKMSIRKILIIEEIVSLCGLHQLVKLRYRCCP
jgi:hypothetical protein